MDDISPSPPAGYTAIPRDLRRVGVVVGWVAVLVPFVLEAATIVRASHFWIVHQLPDDAFYYLEVARRLGKGDGFTFDGTHATNGFHPLWQGLLVPLSRMFPGDDAFAKAALLLGVVLTLLALVLVIRVVQRSVGWGPALFGAALCVQATGAMTNLINGMEGPAVLLALALVLTGIDRWDRLGRRPGDAALVGGLCFVATLARFDLAAVVWLVPVALCIRARTPRVVFPWAAGAAVVGVPFAVLWFGRWGHVLTTSATVKNEGLREQIQSDYGGRLTTGYLGYVGDTAGEYTRAIIQSVRPGEATVDVLARLGLFVLAFVGAISGLRARLRAGRRGVSSAGWAVGVMLIVVATKAAFDVVVAPRWATLWYSAPQQFAVPFVIGAFGWMGLRVIARASTPAAVVVGLVAMVALLPTSLSSVVDASDVARQPTRWQDGLDEAAGWVRSSGPDGRYGAFDAGLVGYELDGDHDVVNLDGLVNSYDYAELLASNPTAAEQFGFNGTDYLINRIDDDWLATELSCGTVLWSSSAPTYSGGTDHPYAPVRVVDVRACRDA